MSKFDKNAHNNLSPEQLRLSDFSIDLKRIIGDNNEYLIGRILTIVDATSADVVQRKATKDLIKNVFNSNRVQIWKVVDSVAIFIGRQLGVDPKHFSDPLYDFKSIKNKEKL